MFNPSKKARIWLTVAFKKFLDTPAEAESSFRKVSLPLAKLCTFSLLTESLATNLLPLTGSGLRPTV